jgi:hypothetical protein
MHQNNQNKKKQTNFRIENKAEKIGDKLFYNGYERPEMIRVLIEGKKDKKKKKKKNQFTLN